MIYYGCNISKEFELNNREILDTLSVHETSGECFFLCIKSEHQNLYPVLL